MEVLSDVHLAPLRCPALTAGSHRLQTIPDPVHQVSWQQAEAFVCKYMA